MSRVIKKKKEKELTAEFKDYQAFMNDRTVFIIKNDGTYKGNFKLSHPYEKKQELEDLLKYLFENGKLN